MKNTKKLLLTVGLALSISSVSFAEEAEETSPISANITIANDYVWRGKTQTADKKTIQGGFDYDAGNGFALGIWGSNIADGSEFDYYGSYSNELENGFGYEVGYIAYRYSKDVADEPANFDEAYVGASYADFGLTYYKGKKIKLEVGNYIEASYGTTINEVDVSLTAGQYSEAVSNDSSDYKVYGIGFGKSYKGLDYALSFTKVSDSDGSAAYNTLDEKNTVFSISKSF